MPSLGEAEELPGGGDTPGQAGADLDHFMHNHHKLGSRPQSQRRQTYGGYLIVKRSVFLLMAGFIFLQGCDRPQGKLIDEILLSPKPELREPLDVTPIVLRYFPLGKDRQAVISELTAQGFEFKYTKAKTEGCAECDPLRIQGYYTKAKFIFPGFITASNIYLNFGFKQGKAVDISADYIREAF